MYPKKCIKKKDNKFLEKINFLKEEVISFFKSFSSFRSFIQYIRQKFHF